MTKPYVDTSIFQGILDWSDASGQKWRAEYLGAQWGVYKLDSSGHYIRVGLASGGASATPRKIHKRCNND